MYQGYCTQQSTMAMMNTMPVGAMKRAKGGTDNSDRDVDEGNEGNEGDDAAGDDGNGSDNYERPHSNQPRSGNDNNASMDKEEGKGGRGYCYGGY